MCALVVRHQAEGYKTMTIGKTIRAKDFICHKCKNQQAISFWPVVDPDIESHAYCQSCLDELQVEFMIAIMDHKYD